VNAAHGRFKFKASRAALAGLPERGGRIVSPIPHGRLMGTAGGAGERPIRMRWGCDRCSYALIGTGPSGRACGRARAQHSAMESASLMVLRSV
jgi:hypothetical protein